MKIKNKKKTDKATKVGKAHSIKRKLHVLADTPLPEIAFISSFILSRWWLNSDFSYPREIWLPIVLFSLLASLCFYIYRALFGKGSAAHLAAIILSYSLYSYSFIHDSAIAGNFIKIIPSSLRTDFTQSIVLALTLAVLAGILAYCIRTVLNKYKTLREFQPYKVLLFAAVFIFSVQAVRCIARYSEIRKELNYHYPSVNLSKSSSNSSNKPDVYYLLFDRYTSAEVLRNNFNYDNSDMIDTLRSKGFVTRDRAYSNYPFTAPSASSTMAMNYLTDFKNKFNDNRKWKSLFPYRSILNNPPIAQVLKQNGYSYNQISSWWDFTRLGIKSDTNPAISFRFQVLGEKFYLSDLQRDILHKSILSPWFKKGITVGDKKIIKYDLDRNPQENFDAQISSLKAVADISDRSQPQYTFAHILAPHPPYVFDADGKWPAYDGEANDNGADEKVKYTNELTYINRRIKQLIEHIQQKSPQAVIILQADEGPYPKQFRGEITSKHYYDPNNLPLPEMKQKFGILASYYMPGLSADQTDTLNSSVNSMRFVLNNYLGYDLPMLPDCQFATGNKFNLYNYQLVNNKLRDSSNPSDCLDL